MDNIVTKTVWQYSEILPEETIKILRSIAIDYCTVKNFIYKKYSGIKSLDRLVPVYSILNEMRYCGLREQLNLPVVYYELAVAEAVTDIKSRWGTVKNKIRKLIAENENLSNDDRMYLRTVIKINSIYYAVLNRQKYEMPENIEGIDIDVKRLNNLLCRLTRKYLTVPQTNCIDSFRISPNGYSYKDGEIRIVCRAPRKRIVIPLKDERTFDRQIQIHVKQNYVALAVPVESKIKKHEEYTNTIYVHIGNRDMCTLSNGNIYGASLEKLINPETERLALKNKERYKTYRVYERSVESGNKEKAQVIEENNFGKLKYDRQKRRERARTITFINTELNKMIRDEKPAKIVITKAVVINKTKFHVKSVNRKLSRNFGSYIRERLAYKCRVHSIDLAEINSNGTAKFCSVCGMEGKVQGQDFLCLNCGLQTTAALNSAKNIQKKYNG